MFRRIGLVFNVIKKTAFLTFFKIVDIGVCIYRVDINPLAALEWLILVTHFNISY